MSTCKTAGRRAGLLRVRNLLETTRHSWLYGFGMFYWVEVRGPVQAAAIAYRLLLYIFPLFGALATLVALVLRDPEQLTRAIGLLLDLFPSQWSETLDAILALGERSVGVGLASLLTLFWFSSSLVTGIVEAFDQQYGVPPRPVARQWLVGLLAVALLALVLVTTVVLLGALAVAVAILEERLLRSGFVVISPVVQVAARSSGFLLAFPLLVAFYWRGPNVALRLLQVLPGAAFGSTLLVGATQLFPLYLKVRPESSFGAALGFIFLLTTWLYFLAHILLLGNALNAYLWRAHQARETPP